MAVGEEQLDAAADALACAALREDGWTSALARIADVAGGWAGQLVGVSATRGVLFNFLSGHSPIAERELIEAGGYDPARNPRLKLIYNPVSLRVYSENDLASAAQRAANPLYHNVFDCYDSAVGVYAVISQTGDARALLSVSRGGRDGALDDDVTRAMTALIPRVRDALRLQEVLEQHGVSAAQGTLDALSLAVFFCDGAGKVVAATAAGERMLRDGRFVMVMRGMLRATHADADRSLAEAIRGCHRGGLAGARAAKAVVLREAGGAALVADVAPLPMGAQALRMGATLMVTLNVPRDRDNPVPLLREAYALTPAQAKIALLVMQGWKLSDIADSRGVSRQTVRNQMKAIFATVGVSSQLELARELASFLGAF